MTQPTPTSPSSGATDQAAGYAGEIGVAELWSALESAPDAVLVDVRTQAEWNFVGVPELSELDKAPVFVEWQAYPTMEINPAFVETVEAAVADRDAPVFLLCRSGARSRAAAIALTAAGYRSCYNITEGFEGPPDAERHRGSTAGWKAQGLPWVQA